MVDLEAEFAAALADADQGWLERVGWPQKVASPIGGAGTARVKSTGKRYEPDDGGARHVIIPVWGGVIMETPGYYGSELIDLIAWNPQLPHTLPLRVGDGVVLGIAALSRVMRYDEPLRLFQDPREWAAAGADRAGAVVIQWDKCTDLLDWPRIVTSSRSHATAAATHIGRLRAKMSPPMPVILIEGNNG